MTIYKHDKALKKYDRYKSTEEGKEWMTQYEDIKENPPMFLNYPAPTPCEAPKEKE